MVPIPQAQHDGYLPPLDQCICGRRRLMCVGIGVAMLGSHADYHCLDHGKSPLQHYATNILQMRVLRFELSYLILPLSTFLPKDLIKPFQMPLRQAKIWTPG